MSRGERSGRSGYYIVLYVKIVTGPVARGIKLVVWKGGVSIIRLRLV